MGKPLREARGETARASQILRYAASEAFRPVGEHFEQSLTGAQVSTRRRPLGVVALITPWNFPIAIPIWKLAPALIYGNTVVLKLAYEAPLTGLHIAEAFAEAELPAGVLNILTGRGSTVGAALVERSARSRDLVHRLGRDRPRRARRGDAHRQARSARAGRPQPDDRDGRRRSRTEPSRRRTRARSGRPGRSAPRLGASTSRRRSTTRSARQLLARDRARQGRRPARSRASRSGRSSTRRSSTRSSSAIERGKREGGTVLAGGERADDHGYLIAPTVFEGVADDAFLSCEEVFGPVTSLYRFDDARRGARARERGRVRAVDRDLHLEPRAPRRVSRTRRRRD